MDAICWAALALAQEPGLDGARPPLPEARRDAPNVGLGPLHLASQSPFRAGPPPDTPSSLGAGRWETRETLTWSRMWAQSDDYLLSFETLNRTVSVLYGLDDRLHMELGAVASSRFAGDLDGFVKRFHDAFDIPQGGRDSVEEGAYHFRVGDVDIPEGRLGESEDRIFAGLRYTLTDGGAYVPALSAAFTASTSEEGVTASLSLAAAKRWGEFYAYLGAELDRHGRESFHGLKLKPWSAGLRAAVEWRPAAGLAFVLQYLWTSEPLDGYGELSGAAHEVGLGLKAELVEGFVFEIGLTENVLVFDSSPDFGMHAGLTTRF